MGVYLLKSLRDNTSKDVWEFTKDVLIAEYSDALNVAGIAHDGQMRKGKGAVPYITHPVTVAHILYVNDFDGQSYIESALLHDTLEDTDTSYITLERNFGARIARTVAALTYIKLVGESTKQKAARMTHTLCSYGTPDFDVVRKIKLADRLHNLRTCNAFSPKKQVEYVQETHAMLEGMRMAFGEPLTEVAPKIVKEIRAICNTIIYGAPDPQAKFVLEGDEWRRTKK